MKRTLTLSLLLLILMTQVRADLLAPGSKWVRHSVIIDNVEELSDLALFTYVLPDGPSFAIEPGKLLSLSGNPIDTNLIVGIPREKLEKLGGKPQPEWFRPRGGDDPNQPLGLGRNYPLEKLELPEGVVLCGKEPPLIRAISASDPTNHIITRLKLTLLPADAPGVKGALRLRYEQVKEEREKGPMPVEASGEASRSAAVEPAWPWLVAVIPGAAVVLMGVLAWTRYQRSKASGGGSTPPPSSTP